MNNKCPYENVLLTFSNIQLPLLFKYHRRVRAQRAAEALVRAVLFVFQALVPGQDLGTVPGVILTGVVKVASQCLEGDVPVLLDGYAFAAAAEAVSLR